MRVSDKIGRDFLELEVLQNSKNSSERFVQASINFIKDKLFRYFEEKKPDYDIVFQGDNYTASSSKFRYLISPLCGEINLRHAVPYFATSITLQKRDVNNEYKTLCCVIDSSATRETYVAEVGKGAFVNSRRMRVSSGTNPSGVFVVISNTDNKGFMRTCIDKYKNIAVTNCEILNICRVASGKYDATILEKYDIFCEGALLLFRESGGLLNKNSDGTIVLSNEFLYLKV